MTSAYSTPPAVSVASVRPVLQPWPSFEENPFDLASGWHRLWTVIRPSVPDTQILLGFEASAQTEDQRWLTIVDERSGFRCERCLTRPANDMLIARIRSPFGREDDPANRWHACAACNKLFSKKNRDGHLRAIAEGWVNYAEGDRVWWLPVRVQGQQEVWLAPDGSVLSAVHPGLRTAIDHWLRREGL